MKKLYLFLAASALLTLCGTASVWAQKSNKIVVKEISKPSSFEEIRLTTFIDVDYTQNQSGKTEVKIHAPEHLMDKIEVDFKGKSLIINTKKGTKITGKEKIKITATSPKINSIVNTGSGDITLKGNVNGDKLEMTLTGSGDIESNGKVDFKNINVKSTGSADLDLSNVVCDKISIATTGSSDVEISNLNANKTTVSVTGSSDVKLSGKTTEADYRTTGSGDIKASKLHAQILTAVSTGSGNIACYASEKLEATSSGSGDIYYYGSPKDTSLKGNKNNIRKK